MSNSGAENSVTNQVATENAGGMTASLVEEQAPVAAQLQDQSADDVLPVEQQQTSDAVANEDYADYADFKLPEGVQLNTQLLGEFKQMAKGLGLKQEQAQALADLGVKQAQSIVGKIEADKSAEVLAWTEASKADKEFGGDKFDENLGIAKKALDAFATPELKAVLAKTGLGNHPELIRAFFKAGKLISEDQLVPGGTKPVLKGKSAAQVLYG
ncbi:hypothetical protein [Methylomonas sp. AM2-LC]|uniref:hypothetical protein n=1 Tax=Methylomonas sp. AM2-LC TaxID=3153301 RepID=UPI003263FE56